MYKKSRKTLLVGFFIICMALSFFVGYFSNTQKEYVIKKEYVEKEVEVAGPIKLLPVTAINQHPLLPTGCEATAAVTVLNYLGDKVTIKEFADNWLLKSRDFYYIEDIMYGPDPNTAFLGDPYTTNSFGCYANAIVSAVNKNSELCIANRINSQNLEELCGYIDNGQPVIIWTTMDMREPSEGKSWILPTGEKFTWIAGEHCMVLVGYSEDRYWFCNPQNGRVEDYDKELCQSRYETLGCQAILINKKPTY